MDLTTYSSTTCWRGFKRGYKVNGTQCSGTLLLFLRINYWARTMSINCRKDYWEVFLTFNVFLIEFIPSKGNNWNWIELFILAKHIWVYTRWRVWCVSGMEITLSRTYLMTIFGTSKINNSDLYHFHRENIHLEIGDDRQLYCQGLFRHSASHESLRYYVISVFATIRRRYS
jgi:hypothetical protein